MHALFYNVKKTQLYVRQLNYKVPTHVNETTEVVTGVKRDHTKYRHSSTHQSVLTGGLTVVTEKERHLKPTSPLCYRPSVMVVLVSLLPVSGSSHLTSF